MAKNCYLFKTTLVCVCVCVWLPASQKDAQSCVVRYSIHVTHYIHVNSLLVGKCKNSCLNNGSSFCVKEHSCHVHFSLITKGLGRGTIVISEFF